MERWDIYDENRMRTGQTMERGEAYAPGAYHLVVHVCLFNAKGEMLIQRRQPFKEGWPGLWDVSVGGSALAGDSSRDAAERETMEELGYRLDLRGARPHFTVNFDRGFDDVYLVEAGDIDLRTLRLQPEEVQQVRWAGKEEILAMVRAGEFIPYRAGVIETCFTMRGPYGMLEL